MNGAGHYRRSESILHVASSIKQGNYSQTAEKASHLHTLIKTFKLVLPTLNLGTNFMEFRYFTKISYFSPNAQCVNRPIP